MFLEYNFFVITATRILTRKEFIKNLRSILQLCCFKCLVKSVKNRCTIHPKKYIATDLYDPLFLEYKLTMARNCYLKYLIRL